MIDNENEEKYIQGSLFDDEESDFLYDIVYESQKGYVLDITKSSSDTEYTYTVTSPTGDYVDSFTDKTNALDLKLSELFKSDIYKKFRNIISKDMQSHATPKVLDKYKKETPYDTGYGKSYYPSKYSWSPSYKTNTEEALKKYGKSNTLCFHKTDPTTTMLEQIYHGKGWDVVNDAYEMSPETIAALIDAHERIVMLGHGSSGGLIGFINSSHAKNLESKKLFALWCNADAYCRQNLPNKKGFFACGNMPSDDNEARWQGFEVSHKYMDDNITYWCKLCGDVVEQCLEGDADAGCKYIRDHYWERYHKGTADEVGITKYNYVRTKVAGQDNLPEPEGEEIEGPKETARERRAKETPSNSTYSYSYYSPKRNQAPVVSRNYEEDDSFKSGDKLFTTTTGAYCVGYHSDDHWDCKLYTKQGKALGTTIFAYIAKNGENVYDSFKKRVNSKDLGDLIKEAEFTPVETQSNDDIIAETDKGYVIVEKKQANGYQYILMKDNKFIHAGSNPTKLKPEDAHSDFSAMLDIGNLI